jgi:prepilin-type N-terminal cleavage/methylation domain-containing protein
VDDHKDFTFVVERERDMTHTDTASRERGFTLIELLVVIAIITILASLLVPAVAKTMLKGQTVGVGNDGRQVWLGLFTTNLEREQTGKSTVWPKSGDYESSTAYFRECMKNQWLGEKYTFGVFAAPGLTKATTIDPLAFSSSNNAWCVVLDSANLHAESPLMFTRNLFGAGGGGGSLTDVKTFDAGAEPFGDGVGVVITVGGAVNIIWQDAEAIDLQADFNPLGADNAFICP